MATRRRIAAVHPTRLRGGAFVAHRLSAPVNAAATWCRDGLVSRDDGGRYSPTTTLQSANDSPDRSPHPPAMSSLGQLMVRVHAGDSPAFAELIQALRPQWAPYRGWSASSADDLQQELWLALWQELQHRVPAVLHHHGGRD